MRRRFAILLAVGGTGWCVSSALSVQPIDHSPHVFAPLSTGITTSLPNPLSAPDWSSIRAARETNRHLVFAVDGGYQARNPGQRWRTNFDGRGFETTPYEGGWSWGLDLLRYGREGAERELQSPFCVDTLGGRVEYFWDDALSEWYINDPRGLEHGFTIAERPTGAGPLLFLLAVRGDLQPRVSDDGRDVAFRNVNGACVVNYNGLAVLDAGGAALPAWFAVADEELRLTVDDRGAAYPLTVDPLIQQAYLKASNTGAQDRFGTSVAVSGDTIVIGASQESSSSTSVNGDQADNSAIGAGAAYVFVRNGSTWSQQAYLKASNTGGNDAFGTSVAVSGDTIVVGAYQESSNSTGVNGDQADNSAIGSGAAYVFVRNGMTWSQQAYLKASNTNAEDWFGHSVAVSDDTVVVGASQESSSSTGVNGDQADNSATYAGASYVFVRSSSTWTQQAYLKASNTDVHDGFGTSAAVSGDTIVIGAPTEDSSAVGVNSANQGGGAASAGAAYVYVRDGATWMQQAYLKASNTDASDDFGFAVALSDDTILVGAIGESSSANGVDGDQSNNEASDSGAAYLFVRNGTTWSQQGYLKASNTDSDDLFGASIATSGETTVVGSWWEDGSANGVDGDQDSNDSSRSGAAYVYVPAPVTNITQGTTHFSIPQAIDVAFNFDRLLSAENRFIQDSVIDYSGKTLNISSRGEINQPPNGELYLADSSSLSAEPGSSIICNGATLIPPLDRAAIYGGLVSMMPSSTLILAAGAGLELDSESSVRLGGYVEIAPFGVLSSDSNILNGGFLNLLDGAISAPQIVNESAAGVIGTTGDVYGAGVIQANVLNDGDVTLVSDTDVFGDFQNSNLVTIQSGVLTIIGTLINNGTIVGDFIGRGGNNGLTVIGDYVAGTNSTLWLSSGSTRIGGNFDVAINDNTRFIADNAELRMVGFGDISQMLEVMSTDIGAIPGGFDRSLPGHYPLDALRVGPTPTTVSLVDNHDNDGLGQATCEAVYVLNLIVNAGATLNTNSCRVYFETATIEGVVDDPWNLVEISTYLLGDIDADSDLDMHDVTALTAVLLGAPLDPAHVDRSDLNGDGAADGLDIQVFVTQILG